MDQIKKIIKQGGPKESDYHNLNKAIGEMAGMTDEQQAYLLKMLEPVMVLETIQGHAYLKPHGYAGDFELIDKIYTNWKSNHPNLGRWDEFFHTQEGAKAVRNRKQYFIDLVCKMEQANRICKC